MLLKIINGNCKAYCVFGPAEQQPTAQQRKTRGSATPPTRPGSNLGLGRDFTSPPGPKSVRSLPAIGCDWTDLRAFRRIKTPDRPHSPRTLTPFLSFLHAASRTVVSTTIGLRRMAAPPQTLSPTRAFNSG